MNKLLLKDKFKQITDNELSIKIYNILCTDENFVYTIIKNGLLFDINKLNNSTIDKINKLLNNETKDINKFSYKSYFVDKFDNSEIKRTKDILEKLKINK